METSEKIDLILEWAERHPFFDTDYVESLSRALRDNGDLTQYQEQGLDNILAKFHIESKAI